MLFNNKNVNKLSEAYFTGENKIFIAMLLFLILISINGKFIKKLTFMFKTKILISSYLYRPPKAFIFIAFGNIKEKDQKQK